MACIIEKWVRREVDLTGLTSTVTVWDPKVFGDRDHPEAPGGELTRQGFPKCSYPLEVVPFHFSTAADCPRCQWFIGLAIGSGDKRRLLNPLAYATK